VGTVSLPRFNPNRHGLKFFAVRAKLQCAGGSSGPDHHKRFSAGRYRPWLRKALIACKIRRTRAEDFSVA